MKNLDNYKNELLKMIHLSNPTLAYTYSQYMPEKYNTFSR